MTPPRPHHEPAPADARRAATTRTAGAALVCAAVALVLVGSGLWPTVAGLVAAVVGLGLAVVALVRSRGTQRRGMLIAGAVVAIGLGVLALVTGAARLALWPVAEAYEQCVSSTLTLSGTARCQQQLEDGIWSYLSGGPGTSEDAAGASTSNASVGLQGPASPSPAPRP